MLQWRRNEWKCHSPLGSEQAHLWGLGTAKGIFSLCGGIKGYHFGTVRHVGTRKIIIQASDKKKKEIGHHYPGRHLAHSLSLVFWIEA